MCSSDIQNYTLMNIHRAHFLSVFASCAWRTMTSYEWILDQNQWSFRILFDYNEAKLLFWMQFTADIGITYFRYFVSEIERHRSNINHTFSHVSLIFKWCVFGLVCVYLFNLNMTTKIVSLHHSEQEETSLPHTDACQWKTTSTVGKHGLMCIRANLF